MKHPKSKRDRRLVSILWFTSFATDANDAVNGSSAWKKSTMFERLLWGKVA